MQLCARDAIHQTETREAVREWRERVESREHCTLIQELPESVLYSCTQRAAGERSPRYGAWAAFDDACGRAELLAHERLEASKPHHFVLACPTPSLARATHRTGCGGVVMRVVRASFQGFLVTVETAACGGLRLSAPRPQLSSPTALLPRSSHTLVASRMHRQLVASRMHHKLIASSIPLSSSSSPRIG